MTKVNIRQLALEILLDAEQGKKLFSEALHTALKRYQYLPKTERAFLTRLCEGTMEYQIYLDYVLNAFSKTKMKDCRACIRVILRLSAYQICFMSHVPKEAAVNEGVKLARKKGFHNLAGFVNGVLRTFVREKDSVSLPDEKKNPIQYLSVKYSAPEWLVSYLSDYYPYSVVSAFFQASLGERPTSIRVNISKTEVATVYKKLLEKDINAAPGLYVKNALRITGYNYMLRVPGFSDGDFAVQDESSMLVGMVTAPRAGSVVLDICAAPGGKSMDIADRLLTAAKHSNSVSSGRVICRDISEEKLEKIRENLMRMGFANVEPELFDGRLLDEKMLEKADYVLCDLPCSGLGVLGKKKDIKYRISREQLDSLGKLQRQMLKNAWQYLKPGGIMIYSTCTVNPVENEENVKWLTEQFPLETEALDEYLPECLKNEDTKKGYLRLMPGIHECDGFFIARLKRV